MLETVSMGCPYCGERIEVVVDCSVPEQSYFEDCFVCCRPILIEASVGDAGVVVAARREDD